MTTAVLDASVVAKWFIGGAPLREQALSVRRTYRVLAPALILVELANTLWRYLRLDALNLDDVVDAVQVVERGATLTADTALVESAQRLSAERDHLVYDCLYAVLAMRERRPLITADLRLIRKLSDVQGLTLVALSTYGEADR